MQTTQSEVHHYEEQNVIKDLKGGNKWEKYVSPIRVQEKTDTNSAQKYKAVNWITKSHKLNRETAATTVTRGGVGDKIGDAGFVNTWCLSRRPAMV